MAKKPWGGAGAWAQESELAESQLEQEEQPQHQQPQSALFSNDAAFPSLGEAASSKIPKKKKQQTLSLGQFIASGPPAFSESKGLTTGEKMALPTGPRDRSGEEPAPGGLGGGFRDYGGFRGEGRSREFGSDYGRERDSGFGSRRSDRDREGRGGFLGDRDDEPSRADSTDDWGAGKKLAPPSRGRYEDDGRRGSRFDDRDSRADDDSDWGSSKKYVPAPSSNVGSRRVSKYDFSSSRAFGSPDSGPDGDSWGAAKKSVPIGGYESSGYKEKDFWTREKDGGDPNSWTRNRDVERVSERPRLVLQPRSQPLESSPPRPSKENAENQPPSSEVSLEVSSKPQKVNPFGEAKPREVILEEKGLNWKKLDAELEQKSLERGEAEEISLKEEIKALQDAIHAAETESTGTSENDSSNTLTTLKEQLSSKELELEQLSMTFKDKVGGFRGGNERARNSSRDSDVWSRPASNGQPASDRKGGRW